LVRGFTSAGRHPEKTANQAKYANNPRSPIPSRNFRRGLADQNVRTGESTLAPSPFQLRLHLCEPSRLCGGLWVRPGTLRLELYIPFGHSQLSRTFLPDSTRRPVVRIGIDWWEHRLRSGGGSHLGWAARSLRQRDGRNGLAYLADSTLRTVVRLGVAWSAVITTRCRL
jgi:hypothetical protein